MREFMKLNRPGMWEAIMQMQEDEDPRKVQELSAAMARKREQIGASIAKRNDSLFGFLPIVMLTMLYGTDLSLHTAVLNLTFTDGIQWRPLLRNLAYDYPTPPATMERLITRLYRLFPPSGADDEKSTSLFMHMQKAYSFTASGVDCPVQHPTLYLFEAFGQALRGDYGDRFIDAVQVSKERR